MGPTASRHLYHTLLVLCLFLSSACLAQSELRDSLESDDADLDSDYLPKPQYRIDHDSGNVSWVEISLTNSSSLSLASSATAAAFSATNDSNTVQLDPSTCPTWWDGIYQWPPTPTNSTISIECHVIFALTMGYIDQEYKGQKHYAKRKCLPTGQWGWNNWTNYTECLNLLAQQEKDTSASNQTQEIIAYIVLILLIASLVSLIISIVIFMTFKPLQCLRIRVHKNLCVALLMNCCLYIVMNSLVGIHRLDLSVVADWFCKMLKCLNLYTSMATINWMFVEGFLFHRRLIAPFHKNTRFYLITYYVIGWLLPAACVTAWALSVEFFSVVANKPCWEGYRSSNTIFIVSTPMILAVGINFIFLISIIRILVTKLRADRSKSDQATIKAIKATALLIPLLGIHHMVVLYNPSTFNRKLVNVYIVINVLFQSVQGIIVSVLYCFTNNEVRSVLNSAWSRRRLSHSFLANQSVNSLHHHTLLGKPVSSRRRQSIGSNSYNSLLGGHTSHHNNNPPPSPSIKEFLSPPSPLPALHLNGSAACYDAADPQHLRLTVSTPTPAMPRNAQSFPAGLHRQALHDTDL